MQMRLLMFSMQGQQWQGFPQTEYALMPRLVYISLSFQTGLS